MTDSRDDEEIRRRQPGIMQRLWFITPRQVAYIWTFSLGFLCGITRISTFDFFWHIAGGRHIVRTGGVAHTDPFSFTRLGSHWTMHEWLWDFIIYYIHSISPVAILVFSAVIGGVIAALMLHLALRLGGDLLHSVPMVMLGLISMSVWINERPGTLQPLFVIAAIILLQAYREGKYRWLLLYPPLMYLWVNFHGSFPAGLGLFGLFVAAEVIQPIRDSEKQKPLIERGGPWKLVVGIFIVSMAVCFIGANGVDGALYPLTYISGDPAWSVQEIAEWQPPDWHEPALQPLELCILLVFVVLILSPKAVQPLDLVLIIGLTHALLVHRRNASLFAAVTVPIATPYLQSYTQSLTTKLDEFTRRVRQFLHNGDGKGRLTLWVLAITIVVATILRVPGPQEPKDVYRVGKYPVKAARFIELNDLKGNMLNTYRWGGYLIWRFYKKRPVFIDGRAGVYGEKLWKKYEKVHKAKEGWQRTLEEFDIQYLVLDAELAICRTLDESEAFTRVYDGKPGYVYVRDDGANAEVVDAYRGGDLRQPPAAFARSWEAFEPIN